MNSSRLPRRTSGKMPATLSSRCTTNKHGDRMPLVSLREGAGPTPKVKDLGLRILRRQRCQSGAKSGRREKSVTHSHHMVELLSFRRSSCSGHLELKRHDASAGRANLRTHPPSTSTATARCNIVTETTNRSWFFTPTKTPSSPASGPLSIATHSPMRGIGQGCADMPDRTIA